MQITGIIAEYDPFHNGHAAHIAAARDAGATHIAVTISGSFTQRGEPAALTKWARARMALAGGADLVLETPLPFAMAPAENFALGGVATLHALGCVDTLSFGSECGDIRALTEIAHITADPACQAHLKQAMHDGIPYAAALQAAVAAVCGEETASLLEQANNTLGIEYIRAAARLGAPLRFHTIPRIGAAHNAPSPTADIASASLLRQYLRKGRIDDAARYMPAACADILREEIADGHAPANPQKLEYALLARLRTMTVDEMAALPYVSEGLENRLYNAVQTADSYDALLTALKTKRYPTARLRRILWAALCGIPSAMPYGTPSYIRVLAMNAHGKEILAAARSTLPIVSQHRHIDELSPAATAVWDVERRGSDLHALLLPRPLPCGTDMTTKLICK